MATIDSVLEAYGKAWTERDENLRHVHLAMAWAEEGVYQDPAGKVEGRAALVAHIGTFLERFPGIRMQVAKKYDSHHDRIRFAWRMVAPDGRIPMHGIDVARIDEDGRMSEIVGFFGDAPEIE